MVNQLRDWHDFYILIATASATLIGLMFVAASVGASIFNAEREIPLRALLTPTVVHFSVILVSCLASMAPSLESGSLGIPIICIGVVGIACACRAVINLGRRGINLRKDLEDWFCYATIPIAIYLALIATGVVLPMRPALGLDMLAGTLVALLLLGIHNAWDMTLWIVLNTQADRTPVDERRSDPDRAPP